MVQQRQTQLNRRGHAQPVALSNAVFTKICIANQLCKGDRQVALRLVKRKQSTGGGAIKLLQKRFAIKTSRVSLRSLKVRNQVVKNNLVWRCPPIALPTLPSGFQSAQL